MIFILSNVIRALKKIESSYVANQCTQTKDWIMAALSNIYWEVFTGNIMQYNILDMQLCKNHSCKYGSTLLNSRDRHEKHGVPLLCASITCLTIYVLYTEND